MTKANSFKRTALQLDEDSDSDASPRVAPPAAKKAGSRAKGTTAPNATPPEASGYESDALMGQITTLVQKHQAHKKQKLLAL